ncbi:outer membrane beta-barrel protein [Sulfurimonas sp. HSL-1716]|uniref:outer membrane beta-barrel protein n=1 Tax=Hydrocurvibacter sulfurireducens TaxID=3131937 RepID=UPI0031F7EE8D
MKRLLKIGLVSLALAGNMAYAQADDFTYNTHSLIGVEGGFGSFDFDHGLVGSTSKNSKGFGEVGIKIGAQTDNYRLFLSARHYSMSDFDYANSIGAEGQYLIDVSKKMNMFVGLNIGVMNFKYKADSSVAKISDKKDYVGGDIGVNFHLRKELDLEVGARYMYLGYSYTNTSTNATANIDHMINGYVSLIYKFKMD